MRIYLDQSVSTPARFLLPLFVLIQPLYIGFIALDNVYLFPKYFPDPKDEKPDRKPTFGEVFCAVGLGYFPLIAADIARVVMLINGIALSDTLFTLLLRGTCVVAASIIVLSAAFALVFSELHETNPKRENSVTFAFRHTIFIAGTCNLATSVVIALLILAV